VRVALVRAGLEAGRIDLDRGLAALDLLRIEAGLRDLERGELDADGIGGLGLRVSGEHDDRIRLGVGGEHRAGRDGRDEERERGRQDE
jgi:hypothetical protein